MNDLSLGTIQALTFEAVRKETVKANAKLFLKGCLN